MQKKLNNIYAFLKANRKYNKLIQVSAYQAALMPYNTVPEKVYSLLHQILNSQSQVKMNKSAEFFQSISANKNSLNSFGGFLKAIGGNANTPLTFKALHHLLQVQPSWGNKTAALFVKAVYHCHIGYAKQLHFWQDAPTTITKDDELYLPVDAVINFIFEQLGNPCPNTFNGINNYLKNTLPNSNFDIWDDLWFWGFITQNSQDKKRILQWNENKYWNLLNSTKDATSIAETKVLANEFIKIIKRKY
jgi:hypothetical protein